MPVFRKTVLLFFGLVGVGWLLYLVSPVRPVVWTPDVFSLIDPTKARPLDNAVEVPLAAQGPEDIAFDGEGNLYTGLVNGDIIKLTPPGFSTQTVVHNTGGRPLGMRYAGEHTLIIADAKLGLLEVNLQTKQQWVLADSYQDLPMKFVDHLAVAQNGDVYFSDASMRFSFEDYLFDFVEASATGRVFKWSKTDRTVTLLADKLYFSNGVALSAQEEYLLINETGRARILKLHLTGEKAGEIDVFVDALPGLPDNLYIDENGIAWAGIVTLRDKSFEDLAHWPSLRRITALISPMWASLRKQHGVVMAFSTDGKPVYQFYGDSITGITTAMPIEGTLYFGFLHGQGLAYLPLDPLNNN